MRQSRSHLMRQARVHPLDLKLYRLSIGCAKNIMIIKNADDVFRVDRLEISVVRTFPCSQPVLTED
jgi:hypothetical protein